MRIMLLLFFFFHVLGDVSSAFGVDADEERLLQRSRFGTCLFEQTATAGVQKCERCSHEFALVAMAMC